MSIPDISATLKSLTRTSLLYSIAKAHNFISRIVGNLRKKKTVQNSVYIKLYEQMLQATDFRIVMLSGTPILNIIGVVSRSIQLGEQPSDLVA